MRSLLFLLSFFITLHLPAQVVITPGALFHISGNGLVTFSDISLLNNGTFSTGNSTVVFKGDNNSNINGSQPVQFYDLQINKQAGSSLVLLRSISVSHHVVFTSGMINLAASNIDLGNTGLLQGEHEGSRIVGNSSGRVTAVRALNAPAGANPGNLGAIITSAENLGMVTVSRGHEVQTNAAGLGNSIRRHFIISPSTTTPLNATLRLRYFDAELNGINENTLVFFRNDDGINWSPQGFSARNTTENWVERTGINSLRSWTLSGAGNALPVQFLLFNVRCDGGNAMITWKTAREQNSSRFDVEKSNDGIQWTVIGTLPASGNSTVEKNYSFTDNNTAQNNYYRIAGYDVDGKMKYTSVLRSPCASKDVFKLWPNPSKRIVFINIVSDAASTAVVKVFDGKGSLVKEQKTAVLRGSNQFNLDLGNLPPGVYAVQAEWNNGQMKNTMQLIKQ